MKQWIFAASMAVLLGFGEAFASTVTVSENDAGKDLRLAKGDFLVVRLPANPSTGYSWYLAVSGATKAEALGVLKIPGDGVYEPVMSGAMVGAPTTSVWTLKALKPGSVRITFNYVRPWEKNVPPVRVVSWPVSVSP